MTGCSYIDEYHSVLRSGKIRCCKKMLAAMELIERKLSDPDVYIDTAKTETAIELIERYFKMPLFPWEKHVLALVHCYYKSTDTVVFTEFLIMMGRGNGKNGFISGLCWYLSSKAHGIPGYNIDIIANSEDQAKTSFNDIYEMLDNTWGKSKRFFHKTKELITNLNTRSYIKYNTSNAKTKDGKRSACLVFDEIHEYINADTIKVFRSGFGKRKHSRAFYITTNGYVREGVLDERLRIADDVLSGEITSSRMLPLIYELDSRDEAADPENWVKANPSLPYLPTLKMEIEANMTEAKYDAVVATDLYTKRFNLPEANLDIAVTDYAKIKATNRGLDPETLHGWSCTVGIDYAELSDMAGINLHFRKDNMRYDINHAFFCLQSKDITRIKAPYKIWAASGHITLVDDVSIHPDLIADYIAAMGRKYNIRCIAMDNFRWTLLSDSFKRIGFDAMDKQRVRLVRPSDIMKIEPVIQECFNRELFIWQDNPCLRWAVNNTKRVRSSRKIGSDTGNFIYAKIEPKSRKTDPFMALVASMTCEDVLGTGLPASPPPMGAILF